MYACIYSAVVSLLSLLLQVFHAQMKQNRMDFAVKVMDQSFIRKENKTAFVLTERKVMSRLTHPNIVKFYCSFRVRQPTSWILCCCCVPLLDC